MDIEQLKLVIETVKSVSGDTQSIVIWWLVVTQVVSILSGALIVGGGYAITVRIVSHLDDSRRLKELREILVPDSHGYVDDSDYRRMRKRVETLVEGK